MSATNTNHRRSLLPAFNLLLASGAIALAVVAIAADDVAGPPAASASASGDDVSARPAPSTTADTVAVDVSCGLRVNTRC